ncbi:MAG: hypothetical protein PVJ09_04080 [Candidatus Woesebacteria bacterium]|jgi:hypothetical protein
MKIQKPKRYQLKIFFKDGRVKHYFSKKRRRILYKVKQAKISEVDFFYLKINYGKILTNFGETVQAINEGNYRTLTDFMIAWEAFNEGV